MSGRPRREYASGSRWAFWRWKLLPQPTDEALPYMDRLHLAHTPKGGLMLHFWRRGDGSPALHDHPVDFVSLVLRGGVVEELPGGFRRRRGPGTLTLLRAEDRHRVVDVEPGTITLVAYGPKRREWGFWPDGKFIDWREYGRKG